MSWWRFTSILRFKAAVSALLKSQYLTAQLALLNGKDSTAGTEFIGGKVFCARFELAISGRAAVKRYPANMALKDLMHVAADHCGNVVGLLFH